jgi:homoserine/homoserine lactone efflux protein
MSWQLWLAFFAAAWAISLSPGPGAVAVMSASLQHGFARGYFATFGLVLGLWTLLLIVGAGVGALLAASSLAFAVVKWIGVAYLVYLGVRQWRAPPLVVTTTPETSARPPTRRRIVVEAWLLNAVNPKGTVFMLAVVPQFLTPSAPLVPQYLAIAATLTLTDLVVNAGYAALAARLFRFLRTPARLRAVQRTFGGVFVALGVLLATFKRA